MTGASTALGLARRHSPGVHFDRRHGRFRTGPVFHGGFGFGIAFARPGFRFSVWLGDPWFFTPYPFHSVYWRHVYWHAPVRRSLWHARQPWLVAWHDPFWMGRSWLLHPAAFDLWPAHHSAFWLARPIVHIWTVLPPPPEPEPERCARVTFRTAAATEYRFDLGLPVLEAATARELQLTLERDLAMGATIELVGVDGVEIRLQPDVVQELSVGPCR